MSDTTHTINNAANAVVDSARQAIGEKSFFEQARDAVGSAVGSTIEAAKENPVAAAAIATGAVAAVAGAAFGISKLLDE